MVVLPATMRCGRLKHMSAANPGIWRLMQAAGRDRPAPSTRGFRRVVLQYALSGVIALILLAAAGVYLLHNVGRDEAVRNARENAELAARGVVEPALTAGILNSEPAAVARLDRIVRRGILRGRIVRVKIWDSSGRIIYSDEHRLIGSRYRSGAEELRGASSTQAEVSDLARPENRFERKFGKLLEVYLPIRGPGCRPLLFETYERYSSVAASGRKLWLAFAPAVLATLALLWLVQLPVAWRGARQLQEHQAQRERLLQRAIESSELERRRIARDLHDGAVQDLAGVSYNLTAAANEVDNENAAAMLSEAAESTRRTIRELRSLLVDIYPPDLHRTGLAPALRDLVAPLGSRGVEASVEAADDLPLRPELETLLYRCAQEALRNVAKHSGAAHVHLRVETDEDVARLLVIDDGRGFDGGADEGHLGLVLLSDLAREAGGTMKLDSKPGQGTRVCVEAPL
jgi:two-component system, NarL family, sensor kinase